ncbi:FecR family protein [Verticiella sediminum]|uniref:FecR family protein n=1 Tax=Verticiella sediminum TaxID=1247510 RepID=UPI001478B94E|nr:FecR domain-containing protein [Verticiella sediminum]
MKRRHRTPPGEPDLACVEQASHWYTALHDGTATEDDRQRFAEWMDTDPTHRLAYERVTWLWGRMDEFARAARSPARHTLEALADRPARRRTVRRAAALMFAAVGAGILAAHGSDLATLGAELRTSNAERRSVDLPDGSQLVLNARSAVDVQYTDAERRIVLRRGEILASVAADPARPFVVQTRDGTATALGTRYSVRVMEHGSTVSVQSSRVRACAAAGPCRDLAAGDSAHVSPGSVTAAQAVDAAASWASGRLSLDDRPLPEVLARLADYRPGWLGYDTEALAGLRVSGVIPLDDSDGALDALAGTLPLRVLRPLPWVTYVQPAPPQPRPAGD